MANSSFREVCFENERPMVRIGRHFWNARKRFWWLGVLAMLVLSLLVWRIWPTPQPYYNGKPLSYWFTQLPKLYSAAFPPNSGAAGIDFRPPFVAGRKIWMAQS